MTVPESRITKKVNTSYLVWFEHSDQWVYLEGPAYFVYALYNDKFPVHAITLKTSKKYHLTEEKAFSFVTEIINEINKLTTVVDVPEKQNIVQILPENNSIQFNSSHTYIIYRKRIKILYETSLLGYYIHPLFQHLEAEPGNEGPVIEFEVFNYGQSIVLRVKNKPDVSWGFNEIRQLKRRLFIEISNAIYNKKEKDWMTFLHASAVTDGRQTILFSSASGSGKSTLSALLYNDGLQLVSDDFVALDAKWKHAFPFPAAISVKEKAFPLFTSENLVELRYQELKNKSVKYLNPGCPEKNWYKAHKVNKIVFVNYNPEVPFSLSLLALQEALRLFYEHASISGNYENTKRFIDWFVKTECYELEYSDNEWGIREIKRLFKDS